MFLWFVKELLQLENLCKELYETTHANIRSEAEKALVAFANSPDCLAKCQLLLERGSVSIMCSLGENLGSFSSRAKSSTSGCRKI